jgi:hypothetical protein
MAGEVWEYVKGMVKLFAAGQAGHQESVPTVSDSCFGGHPWRTTRWALVANSVALRAPPAGLKYGRAYGYREGRQYSRRFLPAGE